MQVANKPRILCIEDNPENRLPVQRILMAEGFELLTAEGPLTGRRAIHAKDATVLIVEDNPSNGDILTVPIRA